MESKLSIIKKILRHYKYLIVVTLGVVLIGFVGKSSCVQRVKYDLQIDDLRDEIDRYRRQNAADSQRLHELKHNPDAVEKIARERYFMKAKDEDIYVLSDDQQTNEQDPDKTDETAQ